MQQLVPTKRRANRALTLHDAMNRMLDPFDMLRAGESFRDPFSIFRTGPFDLWAGLPGTSSPFIPSFDVSEDAKKITVVADVPGYDPANITVTLEDGILTMQGEMREEKEEEDKDKKWHRKECSCGSFYRQMSLPSAIEEDKVQCKAKNGKLTVTVPKKKGELAEGKKLNIEVE